MKPQPTTKHASVVSTVDRKHQLPRIGNKSFAHRYERRKIREQLRHLDWALPDNE